MRYFFKNICSTFALCSMASYSVNAVEIYKSDTVSATIGGYYQIQHISSEGTDELIDNRSRISFGFDQRLTDGWKSKGYLELGVELAENNNGLVLTGDGLKGASSKDDSVWLRVGYIAAEHDVYGKISVGKQWSTYSFVADVTDVLNYFGGNAAGMYNLGTDGGFSGTGRAEQVLQYKNTFNNLTVGLQYQASDEELDVIDENGDVDNNATASFKGGYGLSLIYQLPYHIQIGAAYNQTDLNYGIDNISSIYDDIAKSIMITYGNFDHNGVHIAAVISDFENHELTNKNRLMAETSGLEIYTHYRFYDEKMTAYFAHNALEDESSGVDNQYRRASNTVGFSYAWQKKFIIFTEFNSDDDSTLADGSEDPRDDALVVGVKFAF